MADRHLLTDIRLELAQHELRPVYSVPSRRRTLPAAEGGHALLDYELVGGRDNLAQAITMRLLTPRGELAELGHPEYGSRLHELLGAPASETRLSLAKLFVLEALAQEPRVAEVLEVAVAPPRSRRTEERHLVEIAVRVLPTGAAEAVTVGPITLRFES